MFQSVYCKPYSSTVYDIAQILVNYLVVDNNFNECLTFSLIRAGHLHPGAMNIINCLRIVAYKLQNSD